MVFNSRVVPVFMLWLPKISSSSIVVTNYQMSNCYPIVNSYLSSNIKSQGIVNILLTKITAVQLQSMAALSYHRVRGLYLLAVIFAATTVNARNGAAAILLA